MTTMNPTLLIFFLFVFVSSFLAYNYPKFYAALVAITLSELAYYLFVSITSGAIF